MPDAGDVGAAAPGRAVLPGRGGGRLHARGDIRAGGDGLAVTAPPQLRAFNDFLRRSRIAFSDAEQT